MKAKRSPAPWTEVAWMGGALVMVLWPVGVFLVPAYAYGWPAFSGLPFAETAQFIGFAVSVVGGLLFVSAARSLGRHLTPAIQVQDGHRLVQDGPYRYIRHPVYTAAVVVGAGLTMLYLSPVLALIVLMLACAAHYRARVEEGLLSSQEAFGEEYSEYVARTGRFLPRIRRNR